MLRALLLCTALLQIQAGAAESSVAAPLAAKSLLLAVARAGRNLVAVGDRGHVLVSSDEGRTWTQRIVPARAMLTGVSFPDGQHGWAAGHDGVILATADGGATWARQDGGGELDTIYLDVLFRDARHGCVVGAYGKFLFTADGGRTWTAERPDADEVHYNRIVAGAGDRLYLVGESGTLLTSADGGAKWSRLEVPYDGSLFGLLPGPADTLVAFGLRGHILMSTDLGRSWAPVASGSTALLMAGAVLEDGTLVLAGQGGNFFLSRDGGASFTAWKPAEVSGSVAAIIETTDGALVAVGETGAVRVQRAAR